MRFRHNGLGGGRVYGLHRAGAVERVSSAGAEVLPEGDSLGAAPGPQGGLKRSGRGADGAACISGVLRGRGREHAGPHHHAGGSRLRPYVPLLL